MLLLLFSRRRADDRSTASGSTTTPFAVDWCTSVSTRWEELHVLEKASNVCFVTRWRERERPDRGSGRCPVLCNPTRGRQRRRGERQQPGRSHLAVSSAVEYRRRLARTSGRRLCRVGRLSSDETVVRSKPDREADGAAAERSQNKLRTRQ